MKWMTKRITVPFSNETKEIDAVQLWEVTWLSYGEYMHDKEKHIEAFPTQAEADSFATSLRNAFDLIKGKGKHSVFVHRAR